MVTEAERRKLYGPRHRAERRRWRAIVRAGGAVCCRCGGEIAPDERFHLDHVVGGSANEYAGISHVGCNIGERNRRVNARVRAEARAYRTLVERGAVKPEPEPATEPASTDRVWSRVWF